MIRVQLTKDLVGADAAAIGVPDTVAGTVLVLDMQDAWTLVTSSTAVFADTTRGNRRVVPLRHTAA